MDRVVSLAILAIVCSLFAAPAQATQRERVFVASYGSDSNPCTFGSPCKTFQQAVNVVAPGGEVTAIDSAGFGPVVIEKAVTITSPNGVEAGIAAGPSGTAIDIDAGPNDLIVLSGLTLDGVNSAAYGVRFTDGAQLKVVNCKIRNYTNIGIYAATEVNTLVDIRDTIVSNNTSTYGIAFNPQEPGITTTAALANVTVNNNNTGVLVDANNGPVEVLIADSHIDNNLVDGMSISGSSSSNRAGVVLRRVTFNQTPTAIDVESNANLWLSKVTQTGAPDFTGTVGISAEGMNSVVYSDGTSHFMGSVLSILNSWPPQ